VKIYLPDPKLFIGQQIPNNQDYTIEQLLGSGCNAHVFLARSPVLVRDIACKLIPVANLIGADLSPPTWQQEIQKANRVPSSRVVKFYSTGHWQVDGNEYVFLLSDLVRGESLRQFYRRERRIDVGFIMHFLGDMLDFLRELQEVGLQHGDFHAGNILVEDRTPALTGPRYAFRVTDFGVAPLTTGAQLLDDFDQLASMVRDLLARVDYQSCSAEDRYTFDILNEDILAKGLLEHDRAHDARARNPVVLFHSLQAIRKRFLAVTAGKARRTLITPFDYLSCEQIGESHALLKELYSDKMLGLPALEDVNNLVLTGPRGCGKTTVFRCLSLKHRFHTEDDHPDSVRYIGIYYRCDDLYFGFPRYELPERTEALDVPMHFLSATLIRELLEALTLWLSRHFPESWQANEANAAAEIWEVISISKPQQPGIDTFDGLRRCLDKERERAARKQRFVNDPKQSFGDYFGPAIVPLVCRVLSQHFEELRERPIFFFVDDYSAPKISQALQQNLNRLLMQRSSACFFKLATESPASYESNDVDGKAYVEGREFRLVNLGIDFINAEKDDKLRFVDDIFGRRFAYAEGYPVTTLQALIGDGELELSHNEIARNIREKSYPVIWGRLALGELCSGDVHFLIELVGKMVASVGGRDVLRASEKVPAIPSEAQNKTIRAEAGNFLRNLRALPTGLALVEVVEAFGAVASSYLLHRNSKNEASSPPHQASRIEPYDDPHLEGEAKMIYENLLRYSVFIEDVRGKSRRKSVVPRLYLRRFLIPSFNLTFSKRDSLELSVDDFRELLVSPKTFKERKRLKDPEDMASQPDAKNTGPQLSLPLPSAKKEED
jgi:serine/threonine protein kinase